MKEILLTGAAGGVATMIRPLLRKTWRVRLSDLRPVAPLAPGETDAPADLADLDALRQAVRGVDGIVHLGGYSLEAEWETIHRANIVGCYNLFEAARLEGVLLDPVYTGKAMDGLAGCVADGRVARGTRVLFVHCGGAPSLFPFAKQLGA